MMGMTTTQYRAAFRYLNVPSLDRHRWRAEKGKAFANMDEAVRDAEALLQELDG